MTFDNHQILKLARLARLKLTEPEVVQYREDLNSILSLADRLEAIPTEGVEPLTHPGALCVVLRDDVVTEPNQREAFQALAPAVEQGLYLVPRVVE